MIRAKLPNTQDPTPTAPTKRTMGGHSATNPVTPRMEAARDQTSADEYSRMLGRAAAVGPR